MLPCTSIDKAQPKARDLANSSARITSCQKSFSSPPTFLGSETPKSPFEANS